MIEGIHYATGEPIALRMEEGRIADIKVQGKNPNRELPLIAPGLVDLQVNGYKGLDFNTIPYSLELVKKVTYEMWKQGVTTYLPTIITNSDENIAQALAKIAEARESDPQIFHTIEGIHLEGPFLSPEDGPRGAHAKRYIKPPDWDLFQYWQDHAKGAIRLVTISPEWSGAERFIEKCTASGVQVAIGHTSANGEQIREAIASGARLSTHFGNGSHLMLPRHPNYLWDQLAADELWTCVIADGFHLPKEVLKVVSRLKGKHMILVSDAVSFAGMPAGEYETHIGGRVVLTEQGKLHLKESPQLLAGSAQPLSWGIGHLVQSKIIGLKEAWEAASIHPATFMRLTSAAGIEIGSEADLTLFSWEKGRIQIHETYKHGKRVYQREE